jgi:hypothetical protein
MSGLFFPPTSGIVGVLKEELIFDLLEVGQRFSDA